MIQLEIDSICGMSTSAQEELTGTQKDFQKVDLNVDLGEEQGLVKTDYIEFRDCDFGISEFKYFSIANLTRNQVEFEWRFLDEAFNPEESQTGIKDDVYEGFQIEPRQGTFQNLERLEFKVTYFADSFQASFPKAQLMIKNIPLKSVKNPPKHLVKIMEAREREVQKEMNKSGDKNVDVMDDKVEFSYFNMDFMGQVKPLDYEIDPPMFYNPFKVAIGEKQTTFFKVTNLMNCKGKFQLEFLTKSAQEIITIIEDVLISQPIDENDQLDEDQIQEGQEFNQKAEIGSKNQSGVQENQPINSTVLMSIKNEENVYEIEKFGEIEIVVSFMSSKPMDLASITYRVSYENAKQKDFSIFADFIGPKLRICQPEVDMGTFQEFTESERVIQIENVSTVDTELVIRTEDEHSFDLQSKLLTKNIFKIIF